MSEETPVTILEQDIAAILTGAGISAGIGDFGANKENAATIVASGGYERSMSGTYVGRPTFQVRARNANYLAGKLFCQSIANALHAYSDNPAGAGILCIQQQGDILYLGTDQTGRLQEFSINFVCLDRR